MIDLAANLEKKEILEKFTTQKYLDLNKHISTLFK